MVWLLNGHVSVCDRRLLGWVWQDGRGTSGDQFSQGQTRDTNRGAAASAAEPVQTARAEPGTKVRLGLLSMAAMALLCCSSLTERWGELTAHRAMPSKAVLSAVPSNTESPWCFGCESMGRESVSCTLLAAVESRQTMPGLHHKMACTQGATRRVLAWHAGKYETQAMRRSHAAILRPGRLLTAAACNLK